MFISQISNSAHNEKIRAIYLISLYLITDILHIVYGISHLDNKLNVHMSAFKYANRLKNAMAQAKQSCVTFALPTSSI